MKFFSVDSPIYKFMVTVKDLFLINLCWLIGSLPVVTAGISTVAAFDVTLRMVDQEEGYVMRQFWKAYKANWKQGLPMGLMAMFCAYILYLDIQINKISEKGSFTLIIFGMVTAFLFLFSFLYAFALAARYENTLMRTIRNSFRISMKYFVRTIFTVFVVAVEVAFFFWNMTTLFLGVIIGPAVVIYTIAAMGKPVFRMVEKEYGVTYQNQDTDTDAKEDTDIE